MIRIQGVRFFGAIFHSRERSSLAAEVQQYVRTITSQRVRLPRVKYMVGLDTPDMIVRPRPPKPSLGDSERVYYENVRSSIANKFDAENAAVVIKRCLSDKQLKVMPHVFDECLARNIALESDLLLHLFEQFSGHYMFDAACTVAVQLVRANVKDIDPSLISLALAGSLSTESVRKAADLLFALVRARREDLLQSAGSVKVARTYHGYFHSLIVMRQVTLPDSGTKSWPKQENNAVDCELGVQLFVAALRDGWFSAPACRQFVSILLTPQVLGGPHINKLFRYTPQPMHLYPISIVYNFSVIVLPVPWNRS